MSSPREKEEKALDALISGALLPELNAAKLSDADLDALLAANYITLPEDKASLTKRGNPFRADFASAKVAGGECQAAVHEVAMAMNRKNATDRHSDQARAEMERKTRELLG